MLLNNRIVLQIIDSNFVDDVMAGCDDAVMRMDEEDFAVYFECSVDSIDMETIEDMNVESYEDEETDGILEIDGILEVYVLVNGYAYWDGENEYVGDAEISMGFSFSFQIDLMTNTADSFEMTWEY